MAKPNYEALVSFLHDRFGDSLRWVAAFDHEAFSYHVHYIRKGLESELSEQELDVVIHRSMTVFNKDHVEDVYSHLGEARSLVVEHERAMAIHLYLDDRNGVVVKVERGEEVTLPEFREACLARLEG
ncbi:hypothetical protein [Haloarchaeobius sp. HRN-SO-5]|uniref:hypothetical protein n=1 Tax=Haloarchaeobius sp. HRN-SO-5 TaxID=3446118 RepID=UPI003EB89070